MRVANVAKNFGVAEQTLRNWVNAAGNGGVKRPAAPAVSIEQENSRLRAEVSYLKMELKMERDKRKRAMEYLVRESL